MKSLLTLLAALLFTPVLLAEDNMPPTGDMGLAREWCDSRILDNVEGIYLFPEDNVKVLVRRTDLREKGKDYEILVIDSDDCRLESGQLIGYLGVTIDPERFRMKLFGSKQLGHTVNAAVCSARLKRDGEIMEIESRGMKTSLNPLAFLPGLRRLLNIRIKDPSSDLPVGMIKIYPGYDGEGSLKSNPRYL